jgi:hypothetical protein
MNSACDYLAKIGYAWLLGNAHKPADEYDPESVGGAKRLDDETVISRLLSTKAEARPYESQGARWICEVTWPDRLPGLVTWSGQQTLPKLIAARQGAIKASLAGGDGDRDPLTLTAALPGASGIDPLACVDAIDAGFSPGRLGILIEQRPAVELLAVLGLEQVPLVSFEARSCGFIHDDVLWRFAVEAREGGYYHRWGYVRSASWGPTRKRWAELDTALASRMAPL